MLFTKILEIHKNMKTKQIVTKFSRQGKSMNATDALTKYSFFLDPQTIQLHPLLSFTQT